MTDKIAIVGMACRVPGADTPEELWENLLAGRDEMTAVTPEAAIAAGADATKVHRPDYVLGTHGVGTTYKEFDAKLFGLTDREAALLDPQHRLFAEVAWEALERAGCAGHPDDGPIGVFASAGMNMYMTLLLRELGHETAADDPTVWLLNDPDFLATRLSYALDLRGPSLSAQSACSGSLVSVHLACRALLAGECRIAVAGGSALDLLAERGYLYQQGGIGSVDGRCRPFDSQASGSARGDGAAAVVLKRLSDAIADRDEVMALVLGSAVNNDGHQKAGFTAPSVHGHASVIRDALRAAGLSPGDIEFVEAHGTGTAIGDPVEIRALERVFGADARSEPCRIGSIKANLGHLDAAAGVVGLIKAALVASRRSIPPQANFDSPCDALAASTAIEVSAKTVRLPESTPVRGGVSSLGFGGTNAHVVVSSPPDTLPLERTNGGPVLLPISAMSGWSLREQCRRLADHLDRNGDGVCLDDVGYVLQTGRRQLPRRCYVIANTPQAAVTALADLAEEPQGATDVLPAQLAFAWHPAMADGWNVQEAVAALDGLRAPYDMARTEAGLPEDWAFGYAWAHLLHRLGIEPTAGSAEARLVLSAVAGSLELAELADAARRAEVTTAGPYSLGGRSPAERVLASIADAWAAGHDVDWRQLHTRLRQKTALPTYPFDRLRHWPLTGSRTSELATSTATGRPHTIRWTVAPKSQEPPATLGGSCTVVGPAGAIRDAVERAVRPLFPNGTETCDRLDTLEDLPGADASDPSTVIDLTTLVATSDERSEYVRLCRLLGTASASRPVRFVYVTAEGFAATEADCPSPARSLALGPLLTLPRESRGTAVTMLDLPRGVDAVAVAEAVRDEVPLVRPLVARRSGTRLIPEYVADLTPPSRPPARLRWLITGGLGGVGRALAEEILTTRLNDVVVLTGRKLPEDGVSIGGCRSRLLDVADMGNSHSTRLWLRKTDVCDAAEVQALRDACQQVLEGVDIVLHAAGAATGQRLDQWDPAVSDEVLGAKRDGTIRLLDSFGDGSWLVLFSSLTSVKPYTAAADYTAANAYLNMVPMAQQAGGPSVLTVAWPTWRDLGMSKGVPTGITAADGLRLILDSHRRTGTILLDTADDPLTPQARTDDSVRPAPVLDDRTVESLVRQLWDEVLGFEVADPAANLFDAGADSFSMLRFLTLLEERLEIEFSLDDLFEHLTIGGQTSFITSRLSMRQSSRSGTSDSAEG
ncbi:beta-ketoacyl synthase N-terminal-like domain-containing protein [Streptomyces sp. NPDC057438]|uniref:beta-ketoacyl synthase N-terminal-like domain-containing protein n=1 Tax=Streptomyces sp. NPDC057438 TaxID=3346133 RepID=UPI0036B26C70